MTKGANESIYTWQLKLFFITLQRNFQNLIYYIKVKNKNGEEIIDKISFQTFGCAAAIATSSMVTELAKGKTLDEAFEITRSDVADSLDGLPPIKMHCSNLAADGLHDAIKKYREKKV